jgi:glutaredoxin 3
MKSRPILYIKSGCPWCDDALSYFSRQGVDVEVRDVLQDEKAMKRMYEISGQSLTPTLEFGDFMVADFGVDEFVSAVKKRPDVQEKMGIKG